MIWRVPRMWEGADVWILGGGPSIPKQFGIPDSVVQSVLDGATPPSVYSPYMSVIHDKHVIGINMAYRIGTWMDMIVFGDTGFFLREQKGLSEFPNLKVSLNPGTRQEPWVKYMSRDTSHTKGISSKPGNVSWNGNTGAAAIGIAVQAGAKRIILLGFDMKMGDNKFQHWHDLYNKGQLAVNDQRRLRKLPFDRHLAGFPVIAEDAKALGVTILNACPDSAIQCFPKVSVKDVIEGKV